MEDNHSGIDRLKIFRESNNTLNFVKYVIEISRKTFRGEDKQSSATEYMSGISRGSSFESGEGAICTRRAGKFCSARSPLYRRLR